MAYTEKTWAKIKNDYTLGLVGSVEELTKKYKVSESAINKRISKELWIKNERKGEAEKSIQQILVAELVKRGLHLEVIDACEQLLRATKQVVVPSNSIDPETGQKEPGFVGEQKDFRAIKDGVEQILKIIGGYAPQKQEIDVVVKIEKLQRIVIEAVSLHVPEDKRLACADYMEQRLQEVK